MSKTLRVSDSTHADLVRLAGERNSKAGEVVEFLLNAYTRNRGREHLRAEAERLASDEADLAEIRAVQREMEELRAW